MFFSTSRLPTHSFFLTCISFLLFLGLFCLFSSNAIFLISSLLSYLVLPISVSLLSFMRLFSITFSIFLIVSSNRLPTKAAVVHCFLPTKVFFFLVAFIYFSQVSLLYDPTRPFITITYYYLLPLQTPFLLLFPFSFYVSVFFPPASFLFSFPFISSGGSI